ncbi:MAG: hypothetical protein SFX73_36880 [Kofleriaceae bacterium]|nr:hypothetical protein [Kofleriaceae bacterium]
MRFVLVFLVACGSDPTPKTCEQQLFGRPGPNTGLTAEQCAPSCACAGKAFDVPEPTPAQIAALRTWELVDPPPLLASDPYAAPAPSPPGENAVCAVVRESGMRYRIADFTSAEVATAAGAIPTHFGRCGMCSSLADLAVYMEQPDLTEPVRACGLMGGTMEEQLSCLRALGFTEPCAQIWYFNTQHTRQKCLEPCLLALGKPYHLPDGSLNECLLCDEVQSGEVFKAIAGRTRRNTGVASSMCRPCSEVQLLEHVY